MRFLKKIEGRIRQDKVENETYRVQLTGNVGRNIRNENLWSKIHKAKIEEENQLTFGRKKER